MTYRSVRNRGLVFGTLLAIAPIADVVAGGAVAGLMHFLAAMMGIALLAASLSSGNRSRMGYERYDPS